MGNNVNFVAYYDHALGHSLRIGAYIGAGLPVNMGVNDLTKL